MVQLLLMSKQKKTKDGKKKFRTFFTRIMILVKGEEEKGKQLKTITVKFAEGVDTKDLNRGLLSCSEENIDLPYQWQVRKDDKGEDSYPYIYVKKIDAFEPKQPKSTIEFLFDEEETEPLSVDEEEIEDDSENA